MLSKSYDEVLQYKLSKKKFLGTSSRYLIIYENHIVINKELNRKKPDRTFEISSIRRIIWRYSRERTLQGFCLDTDSQQHEYLGEESVLKLLKLHLAKVLFQSKIQDEYEAIKVVGQGNYALVLELRHLHSEKKFASKCIDKKKLQNIEFGAESVQNEIKVMRMLNHERLVNLIEIYEGDNNIYLIMDLAHGGSLYSEMKKKNNLYTKEEVKIILKSVLEGLQYIHSCNVMHRDLKPENILFTKPDSIDSLVIADFGLATIIDQAPYLFPKCGTPGFVAPEIANLVDKSSMYSPVCDIFSAGVIFHILLFGEGLFNGNGHAEILRLNKLCEFDPFAKKYQRLPYHTQDLLFHMVEKDPTLRYTAQQCLEHPYFSNETQLMKQSSTSSPTKTSFKNFDEYLNNNNSPDVKLMRQNSKRLSLVTHTPIYAPKASHPELSMQQFLLDDAFSFSLDSFKI